MSQTQSPSPQHSHFGNELLGRLHQDVSKYMEVQSIFSKLEQVGLVSQVYEVFNNVMSNEHEYIISELRKIQGQQSELQQGIPFDFIDRYQQNSLIFKSNFQLICNSISDYLWVLLFNQAQKEEIIRNTQQMNSTASLISTPSSPQEVLIIPQQLQSSTAFQTLPIQDSIDLLSNIQVSPSRQDTKKPISTQNPATTDNGQELQLRSKKYLVYDSKQIKQMPSPKSMSLLNLQKNMQTIAANHPGIDRPVNQLGSNLSSKQYTFQKQVNSPLVTQGREQHETVQKYEAIAGGTFGMNSQNGYEIHDKSKRHLLFDPNLNNISNLMIPSQQNSQNLSITAMRELVQSQLQSTRSQAQQVFLKTDQSVDHSRVQI